MKRSTIFEQTIYVGDALEVLRTLPDESVQCCVTSPPYFQLRDYQTGRWVGGRKNCDHKGTPLASSSSLQGYSSDSVKIRTECVPMKSVCRKCGARRIDKQIGLEEAPAAYVEKLVVVFREVRRVLKRNGVLWLNIGDSYCGGGGFSAGAPSVGESKSGKYGTVGALKAGGIKPCGRLKPKDLCGIPWLLAFALRADGYYLRNEIVWYKPNVMPESVTDRCSKAHEQLFLLTKSGQYFFDHDSIKEPCKFPEGSWGSTKKLDCKEYRSFYGEGRRWKGGPLRNPRTVWEIPTQPSRVKHYAGFPEKLVERCLLAGSKPGDVILDPFVGSGTSLAVAHRMGRVGIGIDLSADYAKIARERVKRTAAKLDNASTTGPRRKPDQPVPRRPERNRNAAPQSLSSK